MELSFDDLGPRHKFEDILNAVTEEEIYARYCTDFPNPLFCSPLRNDKNPSFGFYKKDRGRWLWKDVSTGDHGDVFDFVAALEHTTLEGAIANIAKSFGIDSHSFSPVIQPNGYHHEPAGKTPGVKTRALIQAFSRPYSDSDIWCWLRFGIVPEMLGMYSVKVAHEVWMKKQDWKEKRLIWSYKESNPIFFWTSPYSNNIKCYRPLEPDKRHKWLSNMNDISDIQGYLQADIKKMKPPLLLVKSLKEVMFFRSYGFISMAQNAEGYIINPDFIRHLKSYCYPILSLYDRDLSGVKGMVRLKKEHSIPGLVLPGWGAKDPTDLWLHNYRKVYNLLNIINDYFEFIRRGSRMEAYPYGFRHS